MVSRAFRKLAARDALRFEIHARMRDVLRQALVDRLRGEAQMHVARGIGAALDPASPRFADWQVELMRRQAEGLALATNAIRRAALADHQRRRLARKLRDGD